MELDDDGMISVGDEIRRLRAARPGVGRTVILTWEDGDVDTVDLAAHLDKFKVFSPLSDDEIYSSMKMDEWGWAILWPGVPGAGVPSDLLDEISKAQSRCWWCSFRKARFFRRLQSVLPFLSTPRSR